MAREICKKENILYVRLRIKGENISNHAFCLMKLNGLKEEYYSNEIVPNTFHNTTNSYVHALMKQKKTKTDCLRSLSVFVLIVTK